ncbi:MAG: hypothetical protein ACMXYD_04420 [Candidatus Woesearchaeota archaeon]
MKLVRHVLRKLYRRRCIGAKHTAIENCYTGIPKHLQGKAKQTTKHLIQQGIIQTKNTHYGTQVSIHPERIEEVRNILSNNQ